MSRDTVAVTRDGAVATVTLNRPDRMNALTLDAFVEFGSALRVLEAERGIRAVIVTGAGSNFCTGADVERRTGQHPLDRMRTINSVAATLAEFPKPVIAQVEGYAVGAGWNLALLCDLVVASTTAKFSQIFAKRGLSVDFGGSWVLPRLVGLHQAKRLVMLAEMVDAAEAHALGLVSVLAEPSELRTVTQDLARRLAAGPPVAVTQSARLLEQGSSSSLREALENEARAQAVNFATDAPDAFRAFALKRPPAFTGEWVVPGATTASVR
ncbi:enoyl-CoA hydratase/isomerase family protein [Rhodococcus sp. NPDC019627]|uniref:enoyl-CoA hydratase/isomerase family protein n=1 Tax=unclassified Rhodococcus (in: high G+C Gram-positive bacteria) TaxID=192944 RepID=UPI0033D57499